AKRRALIERSVQLIENLAVLLVSDSRQQYQIGLKKWIDQRRQLLADSTHGEFFQSVFEEKFRKKSDNGFESMKSELSKPASGKSVIEILNSTQFRGNVVELAHRIRNQLVDKSDPQAWSDNQRLLKELRRRLYDENEREVRAILKWASGAGEAPDAIAPDDVKVSRERFRTLYWGVLCLVENEYVERAMIEFEGELALWEKHYPNAEDQIGKMRNAQKDLLAKLRTDSGEIKARLYP
ncbi:MAG: hypothetical protein AAF394_15825, partial [Planctomycetota bacterium]